MKALLIVDLQNDFLPGGALPAPYGNQIIPVVNQLINQFELVVASKDWHPEKTVHFEQWPVHCIANSAGADFPSELNHEKITTIVQKGTRDSDDGYSAFEATSLDLKKYLQEKLVKELYICGLTTEYCVKNTVLDALKAGFKTTVIQNAVAGVRAKPGDEDQAWAAMQQAGAKLIPSF